VATVALLAATIAPAAAAPLSDQHHDELLERGRAVVAPRLRQTPLAPPLAPGRSQDEDHASRLSYDGIVKSGRFQIFRFLSGEPPRVQRSGIAAALFPADSSRIK
jgi:hypothetical protein